MNFQSAEPPKNPRPLETAFSEMLNATSRRGLLLFNGRWSVHTYVPTDRNVERIVRVGSRRYRITSPMYERRLAITADSLEELTRALRQATNLPHAPIRADVPPPELLSGDTDTKLHVQELPQTTADSPASSTVRQDDGWTPEPREVGEGFQLTFENALTGQRMSRSPRVDEMQITQTQTRSRSGGTSWGVDLGAWMRAQVRAVGADPEAMVIYRGQWVIESGFEISNWPLHLGDDRTEPRLLTEVGRREVAQEKIRQHFAWRGNLFRPHEDPAHRSLPEQALDFGMRLDDGGAVIERILRCRNVLSSEMELAALYTSLDSDRHAIGFRSTPIATGESGVEVLLCDVSGEAIRSLGEAYELSTAIIQAARERRIPEPRQPTSAAPGHAAGPPPPPHRRQQPHQTGGPERTN